MGQAKNNRCRVGKFYWQDLLKGFPSSRCLEADAVF
jgi:hypothetical protein